MASTLGKRLCQNGTLFKNVLGTQVLSRCGTPVVQVATLRATYGEPFGYAKPYPYLEKKINNVTEWIDITKTRMNENSKIIIVDGNIAVGKNDFGRRLAKAFDLRFYPSVGIDRVYNHCPSGLDLREFNHIVPPSLRYYDLADFYGEKDPYRGKVGMLQFHWTRKRFHNYCSAIIHLLSTGQGVVISSSIWSDVCYPYALWKNGYITKEYYDYHMTMWKDFVPEVPPPHLCIYLDAPIPTIRERINARADPKEINTKMITDEYLEALDYAYKTTATQRLQKHSEMLTIDWSEVGDDLDIDVIAEEMEEIRLEYTGGTKFEDWHFYKEDDLAMFRKILSRPSEIEKITQRALPWQCPEIFAEDEDFLKYEMFVSDHPIISLRPEHYSQISKYPGVFRWRDFMHIDHLTDKKPTKQIEQ